MYVSVSVCVCVCSACLANLVIDLALNRSSYNQIAAREKDSRPSSVLMSKKFDGGNE